MNAFASKTSGRLAAVSVRAIRSHVFVVALIAAAATSTVESRAQAQTSNQQVASTFPRVLVQVAEVKPESVDDFVAIVRDRMIPALRKSGVPWMRTWSPFLGMNFSYVMVTPVSDFAQFDGPDFVERALGADFRSYRAQLARTLTGSHSSLQTVRRDAGIESGDATVPNFATVQTFELLPGRVAEFVGLIASDYVPAYKAGGQRDLWVYVTNFGGPASQITVVRPFFDANEMAGRYSLNRSGLSPEALQQLNTRRNALISREKVEIVHPVRELSYSNATGTVR